MSGYYQEEVDVGWCQIWGGFDEGVNDSQNYKKDLGSIFNNQGERCYQDDIKECALPASIEGDGWQHDKLGDQNKV